MGEELIKSIDTLIQQIKDDPTNPEGWRQIGKALGWKNSFTINKETRLWIKANLKEIPVQQFEEVVGTSFQNYYKVYKKEVKQAILELRRRTSKKELEWERHAKDFFEIKLKGGDGEEQFWRELLTGK